MISSTRELGSFMPKDGSFSNRNESQKERLRFVPAPMVSLGRTGSRGEMNAKYAPLTPSFPNRRYPMLFLKPKAPKRALTKPTLSYTGHSPGYCDEWATCLFRKLFEADFAPFLRDWGSFVEY